MKVVRDKRIEPMSMRLCDVPVGFVFEFDRGRGEPNLRLGNGCGYCELGDAFESVEELDQDRIDVNTEDVKVFGKLESVCIA